MDHSDQPFQELQILLNYYYGRIRLNQSMYAHKAGNQKRALLKLTEAETLLEGWNGMYSKLAFANSVLGNEEKAVHWIQKGLLENPSWKVNLPAFYYLRNHEALSSLIRPENFSTKDWENAVQMLLRFDNQEEAMKIIHEILARNDESSYLYYLLAQCHLEKDDKKSARQALKKALDINQNNMEARLLLNELD